MTALEQHIHEKITRHFAPAHLEVINESDLHGTPSDDSHFKVVLVCKDFDGMRLLQRHRAVNKVLAEELAGPVHALALHVYSVQEWQQLHAVPESPQCRGGSKLES
ncbi:BolA/IbaG family iron-sulfur metabolism protein [Pseudidiomarina gelatinasegens]|uniref:BolA/IbaG family iron-sulfur metabolism protein n=1 Tax=Pseudidiomarina gelatinasegens TaxID=2487740 RepID=UPI003A9848CD